MHSTLVANRKSAGRFRTPILSARLSEPLLRKVQFKSDVTETAEGVPCCRAKPYLRNHGLHLIGIRAFGALRVDRGGDVVIRGTAAHRAVRIRG